MASVSRMLLQNAARSMSSLNVVSQTVLSRDSGLLAALSHLNKLPQLKVNLYSSDSGSTTRILNQSTLIVQDGINIEELPILIKRVSSKSFPFSSHTYTGEKFEEETEFDAAFRQNLHNCYSVNDVFKLLEVPSEKVRGLSASLALQRLHVLKYLNNDWYQIHSFIRSAVMRELYDTVQRDVGLLSSNTLISLVECYLSAEGFSPMCIDAINVEIQSRLGDAVFSVEELLSLAHILKSSKATEIKQTPFFMGLRSSHVSIVSENLSRFLSNEDGDESQIKMDQFDKYSSKSSPQVREEIQLKCSQLLDDVWVHLKSRYQDVDEHTLPVILQALTTDNKSFINLLDKPLAKCWSYLSAEGVGVSLDNLVRLRVCSTAIMTYLGRWAYMNIHQMTPPLLLSFLNTFIRYSFLDDNLVKVMERCLTLKGPLVQTDVVAMCVEYCRSCRYLSPLIMDAAASHFTQYAYSYEPLQLFVVLRAFGQLNYLPVQSTAFLKKVEGCLWDRFDHLQENHLLEILGSFTFIDVLPKNFCGRVYMEDFIARIKKLTSYPKYTALMWLGVLKQAVVLSGSKDLDTNLIWLLQTRKHLHTFSLYHDGHYIAVLSLKTALDQLLGERYYHVLPFYCCYAIYLNSDGVPLEIRTTNTGHIEILGQIARKLVILLRSSEHFTVNTKQLIGAQAQRLKQLKQLGFLPIEVRSVLVVYTERNGVSALMKAYLMPYVKFSKIKSTCVPDEDSQNKLGSENDFTCDDLEDILLSVPSQRKNNDVITVEESGLLTSGHPGGDGRDTDEPD